MLTEETGEREGERDERETERDRERQRELSGQDGIRKKSGKKMWQKDRQQEILRNINKSRSL